MRRLTVFNQQSLDGYFSSTGGASIAKAASTGTAAGAKPAWPGFRTLRVQQVVAETAAVTSIYLTAIGGEPLPPARPGQYLALRVTGAGQPAPVRSYSLSAETKGGTYRISVKQETHGVVSRFIHTGLRVGSTVELAAPRGRTDRDR